MYFTGKDKAVFITKEDYNNPEALQTVVVEEEYGVILPNGEINWDCPCLGGMPKGSCGEDFKAAFSCFHYSQEEQKGSDCIPQFRAMQSCFEKYPDEYPQEKDEIEEESSDSSLSESIPPSSSASQSDTTEEAVEHKDSEPQTATYSTHA